MRTTTRRNGQTMTEYVLILWVVAIALLAAVTLFGNDVKRLFFGSSAELRGERVASLSSTDETGSDGPAASGGGETSGGSGGYAGSLDSLKPGEKLSSPGRDDARTGGEADGGTEGPVTVGTDVLADDAPVASQGVAASFSATADGYRISFSRFESGLTVGDQVRLYGPSGELLGLLTISGIIPEYDETGRMVVGGFTVDVEEGELDLPQGFDPASASGYTVRAAD